MKTTWLSGPWIVSCLIWAYSCAHRSPSLTGLPQFEPKPLPAARLGRNCPTFSKALPTTSTDNFYFGTGVLTLNDRKYLKAARRFLLAIEGDEGKRDNAVGLAYAYHGLGLRDLAFREMCRAIALEPNQVRRDSLVRWINAHDSVPGTTDGLASSYYRVGLGFFAAGEYKKAISSFNQAIKAYPFWPEPHYNRALSFMKVGMIANAIRELRSYLSLKPQAEDRDQVLDLIHGLQTIDAS